MRNRGIGSWAARRARMSPDRIAIVHDGREYTFGAMCERATRLARALEHAGVGHGARVAYLGPNHPSLLECLFAAGLLGATFVPLNTRLAVPELAYILTDCGATMLLWAPGHRDTVGRLAELTPPMGQLPLDEYEATLAAADQTPLDEPVSEDEICMIMYTSGTTGRPKGAMLTHANVAWNTVNLLIDLDLTSTEVTLVAAPMFHVAALNQTVLPTYCKGGTSVLVSAFDPAATLDLVERHRITLLFGVPAMFQAIARSPRWGEADLSSVRTLICGGAPVPESLIATYQERGLTFLQGYGLTEAAPGVTFLRSGESVTKVGSAGTPAFFTDVRLVAADGTDVHPGLPGEVLVHGPNVMAGYWGQPAATEAVVDAAGWLRTGDIAVMDADGHLHIRDRVKDLIISGGENIYPAEVEDVLYRHPAVAECAVFGVPDDRWGEVGRAVVVPRPGLEASAEDLLAFLAGKIARYKIPKSVVFAESLPRTASGKVNKRELRRLGL